MMFFRIFLFFLLTISSQAFLGFDFGSKKKTTSKLLKPLMYELVPMSKTVFKLVNLETKSEKIVDLSGENFIVVSVREPGSDGRFYAVDADGTVWWSGIITSGVPEFRSPSGIFSLLQKKRYHMSNQFPDENGINNMDYMLKFTHQGHALHKGSVKWMSHGCIHIDPKDIPVIFHWANVYTRFVITRHSYMSFAEEDLVKIYAKPKRER